MVLEAEPENSSTKKNSPKTNSLFLSWQQRPLVLLPTDALPTPILLSPLSQYGAMGVSSFSGLYKRSQLLAL